MKIPPKKVTFFRAISLNGRLLVGKKPFNSSLRFHFPQFSVIHDLNWETRVYASGLPIAQIAVPYDTIPTSSSPSLNANGPPESPCFEEFMKNRGKSREIE